MKVFKRFSLGFLAVFLTAYFLAFLLFVVLYLYDPLMFFHKPYFREQSYHNDMRLAARGIIDYAEFDSVILGTSMLENTSAKEAGEKIGTKWVNLSVYGSDFSARKIIFDYMVQHKNIRQIIFSIDLYAMLNGDVEIAGSGVDFKIYSKDFFYLYKKYLNEKFIKCAIKWSKSGECVGLKDLENALKWGLRNQHYFGGFEFWAEDTKEGVLKDYDEFIKNDFTPQSEIKKNFTFKEQQKYLQETIIKMIKENPNVEFHLILPTYSRLFYAFFPLGEKTAHQGRLGEEVFIQSRAILIYLTKELSLYKNARIYGFDTLDYADNIANYKDITHYNVDMNSMHLDAIAQQSHILTPQNIDEYFNTLQDKIKNYDIKPFIKDIKAWHEAYSKKKD